MVANDKPAPALLDIPVKFSGVSIPGNTARIGVKVERGTLTLKNADDIICGRRLLTTIVLGGHDAAAGQTTFVPDLDEQIKATADCNRVGFDAETLSFSLCYKAKDLSVDTLSHFAKKEGRLQILESSEIPEDECLAADDEEDSDHVPGSLKADGPWRKVPLDTMFSGALLKSLKAGGLDTVGALADYSASEKRLTDIAGIGEGKAAQIEDRLLDFWADNQDAEEEAEPAAV